MVQFLEELINLQNESNIKNKFVRIEYVSRLLKSGHEYLSVHNFAGSDEIAVELLGQACCNFLQNIVDFFDHDEYLRYDGFDEYFNNIEIYFSLPSCGMVIFKMVTIKVIDIVLDPSTRLLMIRRLILQINKALTSHGKELTYADLFTHILNMLKLMDLLCICGDYSCQMAILEMILKLVPNIANQEVAQDFFPHKPELQEGVKNLSARDFNARARTFLNMVNGCYKTVTSVEAIKVLLDTPELERTHFQDACWIDFNQKTEGVSVQHPTSTNFSNALFIHKRDIKSIEMKRFRLSFELIDDPDVYIPDLSFTIKPKYVKIILKRDKTRIALINEYFFTTFQHLLNFKGSTLESPEKHQLEQETYLNANYCTKSASSNRSAFSEKSYNCNLMSSEVTSSYMKSDQVFITPGYYQELIEDDKRSEFRVLISRTYVDSEISGDYGVAKKPPLTIQDNPGTNTNDDQLKDIALINEGFKNINIPSNNVAKDESTTCKPADKKVVNWLESITERSATTSKDSLKVSAETDKNKSSESLEFLSAEPLQSSQTVDESILVAQDLTRQKKAISAVPQNLAQMFSTEQTEVSYVTANENLSTDVFAIAGESRNPDLQPHSLELTDSVGQNPSASPENRTFISRRKRRTSLKKKWASSSDKVLVTNGEDLNLSEPTDHKSSASSKTRRVRKALAKGDTHLSSSPKENYQPDMKTSEESPNLLELPKGFDEASKIVKEIEKPLDGVEEDKEDKKKKADIYDKVKNIIIPLTTSRPSSRNKPANQIELSEIIASPVIDLDPLSETDEENEQTQNLHSNVPINLPLECIQFGSSEDINKNSEECMIEKSVINPVELSNKHNKHQIDLIQSEHEINDKPVTQRELMVVLKRYPIDEDPPVIESVDCVKPRAKKSMVKVSGKKERKSKLLLKKRRVVDENDDHQITKISDDKENSPINRKSSDFAGTGSLFDDGIIVENNDNDEPPRSDIAVAQKICTSETLKTNDGVVDSQSSPFFKKRDVLKEIVLNENEGEVKKSKRLTKRNVGHDRVKKRKNDDEAKGKQKVTKVDVCTMQMEANDEKVGKRQTDKNVAVGKTPKKRRLLQKDEVLPKLKVKGKTKKTTSNKVVEVVTVTAVQNTSAECTDVDGANLVPMSEMVENQTDQVLHAKKEGSNQLTLNKKKSEEYVVENSAVNPFEPNKKTSEHQFDLNQSEDMINDVMQTKTSGNTKMTDLLIRRPMAENRTVLESVDCIKPLANKSLCKITDLIKFSTKPRKPILQRKKDREDGGWESSGQEYQKSTNMENSPINRASPDFAGKGPLFDDIIIAGTNDVNDEPPQNEIDVDKIEQVPTSETCDKVVDRQAPPLFKKREALKEIVLNKNTWGVTDSKKLTKLNVDRDQVKKRKNDIRNENTKTPKSKKVNAGSVNREQRTAKLDVFTTQNASDEEDGKRQTEKNAKVGKAPEKRRLLQEDENLPKSLPKGNIGKAASNNLEDVTIAAMENRSKECTDCTSSKEDDTNLVTESKMVEKQTDKLLNATKQGGRTKFTFNLIKNRKNESAPTVYETTHPQIDEMPGEKSDFRTENMVLSPIFPNRTVAELPNTSMIKRIPSQTFPATRLPDRPQNENATQSVEEVFAGLMKKYQISRKDKQQSSFKRYRSRKLRDVTQSYNRHRSRGAWQDVPDDKERVVAKIQKICMNMENLLVKLRTIIGMCPEIV